MMNDTHAMTNGASAPGWLLDPGLLPRVTAPTLRIVGDSEPFADHRTLERWHSQFPTAE